MSCAQNGPDMRSDIDADRQSGAVKVVRGMQARRDGMSGSEGLRACRSCASRVLDSDNGQASGKRPYLLIDKLAQMSRGRVHDMLQDTISCFQSLCLALQALHLRCQGLDCLLCACHLGLLLEAKSPVRGNKRANQ